MARSGLGGEAVGARTQPRVLLPISTASTWKLLGLGLGDKKPSTAPWALSKARSREQKRGTAPSLLQPAMQEGLGEN